MALRISNPLRLLQFLKGFHRAVAEVRTFEPFDASTDVTVTEFSEHSS
jgi:hypothetical protein